MPNEDNIKFVKEFEERTHSYEDFTTACGKAHKLNSVINNAEHRAVHFLNTKVMASATSSLKRTSIEFKPTRGSWRNNSNPKGKYMITFNHKGIGTIYEANDNSNYGETYSDPMSDEDFITLMGEEPMKQALMADLIKQNSMKVLKTFNDAQNVKDSLITISEVCDKYKTKGDRDKIVPTYILPKPIKVLIPLIDGDASLVLREMTVRMLKVSNSDRVVLYQTVEESDDDQHSMDSDEISKSKRLYTPNTYDLKFSEIPSAMLFMQLPDEFITMATALVEQLNKDIEIIEGCMEDIHDKLSVYALLETVKNGEE